MADTLIQGTTIIEDKRNEATSVPIGSIIAWLKSFTNTPSIPSGWVECNGAVLSDADSIYNGATLPDLNGNNQFTRGNSTSGGTGGAEKHSLERIGSPFASKSITANLYADESNDATAMGSDGGAGGLTIKNILPRTEDGKPPFYDVVWIMKIK